MTVKRMDNVGIVVEDIDAAIEFFTELGLDPWWLRGAMPRPEAEAALTRAGIRYLPTVMRDPSMDGIVTASGVTMGFIRDDEEFSPPAGLYSICRDLRDQMTA